MIEVSKETFAVFFEDNLGELNRSPSFDENECSINWYWAEKKQQKACKIVESKYDKCQWYVTI